MRLLTHIHHILKPWVDDKRAILYDICRLWGMIQDHFLPGPITGVPLAFTNPKQSLPPTQLCSQTWLCCFSVCLTEQYAHIHLGYLIDLSFLWFKKKEKEIKKKKTASTVSHTQRGWMTPRSVILERQSRMTLTFHFAEMPVDYSVNWRMRETDRRKREREGEKNKTKIGLFRRETDIWIHGDVPNISWAAFTDKFLVAIVRQQRRRRRQLQYLLHFPMTPPNEGRL